MDEISADTVPLPTFISRKWNCQEILKEVNDILRKKVRDPRVQDVNITDVHVTGEPSSRRTNPRALFKPSCAFSLSDALSDNKL
jgi:hypothetical protein